MEGENPEFDISVMFERISSGLHSRVKDLEAKNAELARELADKTDTRQYEIRIARHENVQDYKAFRLSTTGEVTHVLAVQGDKITEKDLSELKRQVPLSTVVVNLPPGHEFQVYEIARK